MGFEVFVDLLSMLKFSSDMIRSRLDGCEVELIGAGKCTKHEVARADGEVRVIRALVGQGSRVQVSATL